MDPSKPESFNHKTEKLSTGRTYHFVDQTPDGYDPQQTITLLLVHGFPDLWFGWRYQIGPWVKAGYRVVVPDMLGYGGTDKPTDLAAYTHKKLSADLSAILDLIGVRKAVIVGHDWGSVIVGRFALWHPDRLLALIHLSVAFSGVSPVYIPLEQIVERAPYFGYQLYFVDESSTKEIEANIKTFFKVTYSLGVPGGPEWTAKGAIRSLITGEVKLDESIPNLLSDEDMSYVLSQISTMHGPLSYYRIRKLCFDEERAANLTGKFDPDLPVMFIRGVRDPIATDELAERMKTLVPNVKAVSVDAGHWLMVDYKGPVVAEVIAWLKDLNVKPKL